VSLRLKTRNGEQKRLMGKGGGRRRGGVIETRLSGRCKIPEGEKGKDQDEGQGRRRRLGERAWKGTCEWEGKVQTRVEKGWGGWARKRR